MNLQCFPRDFLLKLKPDLEQAEAARLASATSGSPPASSAAGFLTVSPRSTDEPGVVEVVIRLKLTADGALVRTHRLNLQPVATIATVDVPKTPYTSGEL